MRTRNGRPKYTPSCNVVLIRHGCPTTAREVDDALDVVLIEYFAELALIFGWEENAFCGDIRQVVEELLDFL